MPVQKVLGDEKFSEKLGKSLENLPEFLAEGRQTLTAAREDAGRLQRASKKRKSTWITWNH